MIKPLGERVLIKPIEISNTTKAGIILTTNKEEKPDKGIIEHSGDTSLNKGSTVFYNKYTALEVEDEGIKYLILKLNDIYALIK